MNRKEILIVGKSISVVDKVPYCYMYLIRLLESVPPVAEVVDDHHDDDNELSVCYSGLISATNRRSRDPRVP